MNNTHLSSYPSIYTVGHRELAKLFDGPVVIEEKVDGSQFSMARMGGELVCRSKGTQIYQGAVPKLFNEAVATAESLKLVDGWVYRGEYLQKPRHNTLLYGRTPIKNVILFDVMIGPEIYLDPESKAAEAARLGLECVPTFYYGPVDSFQNCEQFMQKESVLGGCLIEGFVVKNYSQFGSDKKILVGKYVSEAFKEKHRGEWKNTNPGTKDVVQDLISQLKTEARWRKAVQHLRDEGKLTDDPRDIGPLLKELQTDLEKEELDYITQRLLSHFLPQIKRGVCSGFPEFYKRLVSLPLPGEEVAK